MTALNLNPKTATVAAASIKPGHVILESHEHPAKVTRLGVSPFGIAIYCRYVWQASSEKDWLLGRFAPHSPIEKAVN